jgi:dTDP-4-dehydrorhamnose reductase
VKIALLGVSGMLGSKMAEVLKTRGHELVAPAETEMDINRPHVIEKFFKTQNFEVLINCAAFTRVDACEEPAKFSMAFNVNGTAVGWLAKFCKKMGRTLIHYSTDYVYNGQKEEPYQETDPTDPLNTYGKTKLQGDKLIQAENPFYYIIRTSWLYGPHGTNFVGNIIGLLKTKPRLEVVSDQVGGPTYTGDLALFTLHLLEKKAPAGLYHFSNEGHISWFDFAKEIQKQTGLTSCFITPVMSENIFRPAPRPANSRFDLSKARSTGYVIRPWQEALKDYLTKEFKIETA